VSIYKFFSQSINIIDSSSYEKGKKSNREGYKRGIRMNFVRRQIDTQIERNLITGMIVSDRFLKECQSFFRRELLQVPFCQIISDWCVTYFEKYKEAPLKTIEDIFEAKKRTSLDDVQSSLIHDFINELSMEYMEMKDFNVQYMLDQSEKYMRQQALKALCNDITTSLLSDDIEESESLVTNYSRLTRPSTRGVNVLVDKEAMEDALKEEDTLFCLPGVWGEMVGPLVRGDFLGIMAPFGRNKTFALIEIALHSLKKGFKTVFISLEMTQRQIMRRIMKNLMRETLQPSVVRIPVLDCALHQLNECANPNRIQCGCGLKEIIEVPKEHKPCTVCKNSVNFVPVIYFVLKKTRGIDVERMFKRSLRIQKMVGEGQLRLLCFPGGSVTMNDLRACLDNIEYYENFVPSVILTDYADFFKPVGSFRETRHQIDEIWKSHRSLAQERDCLVGTVTHTNKETLERKIRQSDPAEDSRKLWHLTKAFALDQTDEERRKDIISVSMMKIREEGFSVSDEVKILQCLGIGKFYLDSYKIIEEECTKKG